MQAQSKYESIPRGLVPLSPGELRGFFEAADARDEGKRSRDIALAEAETEVHDLVRPRMSTRCLAAEPQDCL